MSGLEKVVETHMACLNHKGLIVACDCGFECDWRAWCAHVAAEITAYLLSDETVERAATIAYHATDRFNASPDDITRAALNAALTEGMGE